VREKGIERERERERERGVGGTAYFESVAGVHVCICGCVYVRGCVYVSADGHV